MSRALNLSLTLIMLVGCTQVTVKKAPGPNDKGFRYYRPKPYLMITPGEVEKKEEKPVFTANTTVRQGNALKIVPESGEQSSTQNSGVRVVDYAEEIPPVNAAGLVAPPATAPTPAPGANEPQFSPQDAKIKASISLMYLPDFAEEYSVRLRPGLGVGELSMKLENGWNLTSVGMKTDQQTDEIINSVANLVGSAGKVLAPSGIDGTTKATPVAQVLATNIPFGLYEAVIAEDPCGVKQLYGWRYVGFMPFQACPVKPSGMNSVTCHDPNAIYGMVMDNTGTMRFEKIAEIPYMEQKVKAIKLRDQ